MFKTHKWGVTQGWETLLLAGRDFVAVNLKESSPDSLEPGKTLAVCFMYYKKKVTATVGYLNVTNYHRQIQSGYLVGCFAM